MFRYLKDYPFFIYGIITTTKNFVSYSFKVIFLGFEIKQLHVYFLCPSVYSLTILEALISDFLQRTLSTFAVFQSLSRNQTSYKSKVYTISHNSLSAETQYHHQRHLLFKYHRLSCKSAVYLPICRKNYHMQKSTYKLFLT